MRTARLPQSSPLPNKIKGGGGGACGQCGKLAERVFQAAVGKVGRPAVEAM